MSSASRVPSTAREPRRFRVMLGLAGFFYLAWWFAVEWLLPGAFNPLASRLAVVAYFLGALALTFVSPRARRRAEPLFYVGALLLLGHYFYLLRFNAADINWAVGAYVVVIALSVWVDSRPWLLASVLVALGGGFAVWQLEPLLQRSIFLPGLATIVSLCAAVQLSRIRMLEGLQESAGRFQSLFDATFEGVSVHDGGTIIDANAAFATLFGYAREELFGRAVIDLVAPEQRARAITQLTDADAMRYETTCLRKDGSTFAVEVSSKPHIYKGRLLRLAAVRDISDRQRREHDRAALIREQAASASAQEAIRERDEFISIASHELRTPITSLLLHMEVFERRWQREQRAADVETYAARVRRHVGRMKRLVEELLDVSRLGSGPVFLSLESVELEAVVHDVIDALSEDLRRAGCQVQVHATGALLGTWDRLRLEQVVENLLRNAMIYGVGKPIELSLSRASEQRVLLSVRDHGIGIEPALHERVFLRFERGVSAKHYGGLGLGLYIARQIVEAHHGTIRVESELGRGATFRVELPVLQSTRTEAHQLGPTADLDPAAQADERV